MTNRQEKNKEKNFVSAVVYVYNNEECIQGFLSFVHQILENNFEKYQIICVNDASTDKSFEKIQETAKKMRGTVINVINMSYYQGLELSMNAGIDLSIGDFIFEFDHMLMDFEAHLIIDLYKRALNGFDIVNAAPKKCFQKSSWLFYALFNHFSLTNHPLRTENFRVISRRAINRVHSVSKTIPYRKAVYANCGLKIDTIEYENDSDVSRHYNKETKNQRKEIATTSLVLFTDIAYKISMVATVFMMLATFGIGVYTFYCYIAEQVVSGYTSMMLVIAGGFFGIFAILAVIIKYLSILMDLVFSEKKYTIESIETISQ